MTKRLLIVVAVASVIAVGCGPAYYSIQVTNPCNHPLDALVSQTSEAATPEERDALVSDEFDVTGRVVSFGENTAVGNTTYILEQEEADDDNTPPEYTVWVDSAEYSVDVTDFNREGRAFVELPTEVCVGNN